jgi:hypothetical protein
MQTDQFQKLCVDANRVAHVQLAVVLTGERSGAISATSNGAVQIDLSAVSVADFTSSAVLCSESFERPLALSESADDLIELVQVVMAEHTPFAQSAVDFGFDEPQAAASSTIARMRTTTRARCI